MKNRALLFLTLALSACTTSGTRYTSPHGYSIIQPDGWTVKENDRLISDVAESSGTAFILPDAEHEGTKLIEAKVHIEVSNGCPAGLQDTTTEVIRGRTYTHGYWSGAAAGNLYTGDVYMTVQGSTCYVLTLYEHLCNLGVDCGPQLGKEYDTKKLLDTFMKMVRSFHLTAS